MLRLFGLLSLIRYAPKVAPWLLIGWLSVVDGSALVKDSVVAWWQTPAADAVVTPTTWSSFWGCTACDHARDSKPSDGVCTRCGGCEWKHWSGQKLQVVAWGPDFTRGMRTRSGDVYWYGKPYKIGGAK